MIYSAVVFHYRSVPSLEPLLQVFGRGLRGNGTYNRVQQGAPEEGKQPAQAAGRAGNRGPSAADAIERNRSVELHLGLKSLSDVYEYTVQSIMNTDFYVIIAVAICSPTQMKDESEQCQGHALY